VFDRIHAPSGPRGSCTEAAESEWSPVVLDIVYALGVIALFVVVGLLAKAVEKL